MRFNKDVQRAKARAYFNVRFLPQPEKEPLMPIQTKLNCPTLEKCAEDEPIFVLCARDVQSPEGVQRWIDVMRPFLGVDHPKIKSAIETRDAMTAWQVAHFPNGPNLPG